MPFYPAYPLVGQQFVLMAVAPTDRRIEFVVWGFEPMAIAGRRDLELDRR